MCVLHTLHSEFFFFILLLLSQLFLFLLIKIIKSIIGRSILSISQFLLHDLLASFINLRVHALRYLHCACFLSLAHFVAYFCLEFLLVFNELVEVPSLVLVMVGNQLWVESTTLQVFVLNFILALLQLDTLVVLEFRNSLSEIFFSQLFLKIKTLIRSANKIKTRGLLWTLYDILTLCSSLKISSYDIRSVLPYS